MNNLRTILYVIAAFILAFILYAVLLHNEDFNTQVDPTDPRIAELCADVSAMEWLLRKCIGWDN